MTIGKAHRDGSLESAARGLFPPWVGIAAGDPTVAAAGLHPDESRDMAHAVERRRREFAAGRRAARQAMAALALPPCAILVGSDRAPIWPEGVVASISHADTACIAVVARTADARAIGVDLEPALPLAPDDWYSISTPEERAWLAGQPDSCQGLLARLIFSAKECAYKCQYALTRRLLGFDVIAIEVDGGTGSFRARFCEPAGEFQAGDHLPGRFILGGSLIVTAMALAA